MRWLVLLFTLSAFSQVTFGQTGFCLPGATWVYYHPSNGINFGLETKVTYVGDTTIFPFTSVQVLEEQNWQFQPGFGQMNFGDREYLIARKGDSIHQFVNGYWEFIFDFGVTEGDTREVYIEGQECSSHDTMFIESIDTISFQGEELRRINYKLLVEDQLGYVNNQFEYVYAWNPVQGSYLEKVGFWRKSPIGEKMSCYSGPGSLYLPQNLVCYTDDEILQNGGEPCSLALSVETIRKPINPKILNDFYGVEIQNALNSTLRIYDILGKQLLQERITSDNQSFDLNYFPSGILMVVIENETTQITQKIFNPTQN